MADSWNHRHHRDGEGEVEFYEANGSFYGGSLTLCNTASKLLFIELTLRAFLNGDHNRGNSGP